MLVQDPEVPWDAEASDWLAAFDTARSLYTVLDFPEVHLIGISFQYLPGCASANRKFEKAAFRSCNCCSAEHPAYFILHFDCHCPYGVVSIITHPDASRSYVSTW